MMRTLPSFVAVAFLGIALAGCIQSEDPAPSVPQLLITIDFDEQPLVIHADGAFDDGIDPATIHWDWGDGTSAIGDPGMSHTYIRNGTYNVTAGADHPASGRITAAQPIVVGTSPPSEDGIDPEEPAENTTAGAEDQQPFEATDPQESCGNLDSLEPVLPTEGDPTGAAGSWPLLQLDVVMLADWSFYESNPDDWEALLYDLVADANVYYEDQLGLRLHVILTHHFENGTMEAGTHDGQMRAIARGYMHANHADLDFDYVAVILGADYEATTAGMVECVHGAVNKDNAYLWSEYIEPRQESGSVGDFFLDVPLKVFMHESAHLLAAHHHYTQCGTTMTGFRPDDALAACGVMVNDIGLASFQFSATNRLVIRSFVEELGIGEPVD